MHLFENAKGIVHSLMYSNTGTIAALRELTIPEKKFKRRKARRRARRRRKRGGGEGVIAINITEFRCATGDGDMTSTTMTT